MLQIHDVQYLHHFWDFLLAANFWLQREKEPNRGSTRSRLSAFVQISALFQIYITDMSRHLHHLTNCPFEVKKGGLKGLFLYWEVILLIFFVFVVAKRYFFWQEKASVMWWFRAFVAT